VQFIRVYTQPQLAAQWLQRYQGKQPIYACVLGFTETGLIPGISAAGATPESRQYTAIADAEFLVKGPGHVARYPLPPLDQGASPVFISRAVLSGQQIPIWLFDAGLPVPPAVSAISLQGSPANCLSTGNAQNLQTVQALFEAGFDWGHTLAQQAQDGYLIVAECVVGGTTTALGVLAGLGFDAQGKVNSSHPICNHTQKWQLVCQGLAQLPAHDPWTVLTALGDPMQGVVAGMMLAASRQCGVLLAGGTQMLAVYALARAIALQQNLDWHPEQVVVGTTRWVVEDPTGDTIALAQAIGSVPLLATPLSFAHSSYPQLRAYEQGFVKEGVGAGGCAIAAQLYQGWEQTQILTAVEAQLTEYLLQISHKRESAWICA
jgi:uncharacterized protein (TIGR00303 family)